MSESGGAEVLPASQRVSTVHAESRLKGTGPPEQRQVGRSAGKPHHCWVLRLPLSGARGFRRPRPPVRRGRPTRSLHRPT